MGFTGLPIAMAFFLGTQTKSHRHREELLNQNASITPYTALAKRAPPKKPTAALS